MIKYNIFKQFKYLGHLIVGNVNVAQPTPKKKKIVIMIFK